MIKIVGNEIFRKKIESLSFELQEVLLSALFLVMYADNFIDLDEEEAIQSIMTSVKLKNDGSGKLSVERIIAKVRNALSDEDLLKEITDSIKKIEGWCFHPFAVNGSFFAGWNCPKSHKSAEMIYPD